MSVKNTIFVTKRDGRKEPLNIEKIHKVVFRACKGIQGVSPSEVEIRSQLQFYPDIKTSDIQETLIKAAADLISEESPNYQYVAGRLINYHLRKQVYGQFRPWHIIDLIKRNIKLGLYTEDLLKWYTEREWNTINGFIKHKRDRSLTYAAMEQFRGKYLVQNRYTGEICETPQMCFILIAATLFHRYSKRIRLKYVKDYYDMISEHYIQLPTPVLAGVRTPQKQFSSCVLIECDDSLDSISATTSAIVKYVSQKAGIGIGAGKIRAIGSPVRKGDTVHTGVIPFYRLFQSAVKSCSQGGVRGGSATLYYVIWHLEIRDMLVLKNNKGTEDNRIRHIDYGVIVSKLFYRRLIQNKNITLFSPSDVPDLYRSFFVNQELFNKLYCEYEKRTDIRKKVINARELFGLFMQERKDTGRIYLLNVCNANNHSPYFPRKVPIRMSNLCARITLGTVPLKDKNAGYYRSYVKVSKSKLRKYLEFRKNWKNLIPPPEYINTDLYSIVNWNSVNKCPDSVYFKRKIICLETGAIALCTLSAINWGKINNPSDFRKPCMLAVRALDRLLDYQEYPVRAARGNTLCYRQLGIGITNFAYWLAKNRLKYTRCDLRKVSEYAEAWSYYLIKASVRLAKRKGPAPLHYNSRYSAGILPIDTYKKDVDRLVSNNLKMDWNSLREDLKKYGIRNTTLMAIMPCESSSQISNSTNGVRPPRNYISVKQSKHGVLKQVVPEFKRLKNKYRLLWSQKSPEGYLKIMAVLQKFVDQSISVNTSYNPLYYENRQIPMSEMIKHLLLCYKWGLKTLYYFNQYDGQGRIDVRKFVKNEFEVIQDSNNSLEEEDCDSCKI